MTHQTQEISEHTKQKATEALRYIMLTKASKATDGLRKLVFTGGTPDWVFGLFNEASAEDGILDHRRQLMVYDTLKALSDGLQRHNVMPDREMAKLKSWRSSASRRAQYMTDVVASTSKRHLQKAQRIERQEVFDIVLANIRST